MSQSSSFVVALLVCTTIVKAQKSPDFAYREVYFPQVTANKQFAEKYKTMPLDLTWGLWGHNLHKIVDLKNASDSLYALREGSRIKDQFCFSSRQLYKALSAHIKERVSYRYFMITPQDNDIVCTCDRCQMYGNSKNDASPAVFQLMRKLASEFPDRKFFTTAYKTINSLPDTQMPGNTGVFLSTIDFQNSLPYTMQPDGKLGMQIKKWKNKFSEVYAWEYILNYDQYFDPYPNLFVLQENLKYLKKMGIDGIFINGGETYSFLESVKAAVVARLLQDTEADLEQLIRDEVSSRFDEPVRKVISDFYNTLNKRFAENDVKMGIYSGIDDALDKYLVPGELYDFSEKVFAFAKARPKNAPLQNLSLALLFLELEVRRTKGLAPEGSLSLQSGLLSLKDNIARLLVHLKEKSQVTGVKVYSEVGDSIKSYLDSWLTLMGSMPTKNRLIGKSLEYSGQLDDQYQDISVLNDGATGFTDYQINWWINSSEEFEIELPLTGQTSFRYLEIGFLNDPKHGIYVPQSIVTEVGNKKRIYKIPPLGALKRETIKILLNIFNDDKELKVAIIRRQRQGKNTWAIDEIILR